MVAVMSLCVCVSYVDPVLQCVQCASCACRGRSHHYRARNSDAGTMCVCLLAAHLSISLLPFYSPLFAQIGSPISATLLLLLLLLVYAENDDDCVACVETELLCGSKDPSVHWRPVGESSWTACRTDKKQDSRDLTEEEAFNAIFCDFAAKSCSDHDGTNNSVGTEEYLTPDLTTPNTADVCSDGTVSVVFGHPPRRQGADKQRCVQQRHTEHICFKQEDLSEQRNLVRR
ncbi:hypothetical protein ECC02_007997 [Trypanosoma cruzi]|uniref:Uncharacterized protein n=1 Tax=Trypanosoma cruzi TaxID=5693 RepID=A0A7J6XX18_TRYCR|nr:hypothetical protein ECC02_007997 [Trypanosoma cruzi]